MSKLKSISDRYHPPDGGWGWMIVIAYGVANILIIPVMQSFGLIFKDKFADMNMTATQFSLIINLNSAFGMSVGIINGPLLRTFGYRKVAAVAGFIFSAGLFMTSFASSFTHFLITYSIITSIGTGLSTSSFSLALNTYFKRLRNKAAGIAMTITGFGPILMPQLVSLLLLKYDSQGTLMVISSMTLHIIVGACLLQPIKWHAIPAELENVKGPTAADACHAPIQNQTIYEVDESKSELSLNKLKSRSPSNLSSAHDEIWEGETEDEDDYLEFPVKFVSLNHNIDSQSIYGFDSVKQVRVGNNPKHVDYSLPEFKITTKEAEIELALIQAAQTKARATSLTSHDQADMVPRALKPSSPKAKRWFESGSADTVNLGSSVGIFDEHDPHKHNASLVKLNGAGGDRRKSSLKMLKSSFSFSDLQTHKEADENDTFHGNANQDKKSAIKKRIIRFFDLDLLKDKIYVNIMLGLSLAIFAEINFSLLTPFILSDLNYSTKEIAAIMSVLATADIIVRFVSPFIGDYFRQPPRIMYMYSLFLLLLGRTSFLFATSYPAMLLVGIGLGIGKGVRSVYMGLVIPTYVPLERLPAASGIQMVCNSIFLLSLGPILGIIRDRSGSFLNCIIFINFLSFLTLAMWSFEYIFRACKSPKD